MTNLSSLGILNNWWNLKDTVLKDSGSSSGNNIITQFIYIRKRCTLTIQVTINDSTIRELRIRDVVCYNGLNFAANEFRDLLLGIERREGRH